MDTNRLRAVMVLHGDTGAQLAAALGISRAALSMKMNGKSQFTQREIWRIKERYGLSAEDIDRIFFASRVS